MTEYNCILPLLVRFRGIPNIDRLVELTDAITQGFSRRLLFADHAISEHEGWPAWHKIHAAPKLIFTGDPLDQDLQKRVAESIEAGIARALTAQAATASPALPFVPAQYHPPPKRIAPVRQAVAKKTLDVPWRVRIKVNFHIKPREFFTIRKNLPSLRPMEDEVDPMEAYYPLLDTRQPAVAWVVETLREYEFVTLADEVFHRFAVSRTSNEFVWSVAGWSNLRKPIVQADQDGQIARRVPEFTTRGFSESRPGPGDGETQLILRPGAWIFAVFLPLPRLKLDDLVVLETPQTIDVPLSEASILIAPEVFKTEVGLDLAQIEKEAPDCTVTVVAEVFTVRRKVHERALAALFEQYRRHTQGVRRLGQILPLLGPAFQQIGPTLGPFLQGLANTNPAKQHGKIENGFWQPGTRGVNITPLFLNDFVDRVLRKANAALISSQADEVQRILTLKNTIWSVDRDPALERFINFYWGRLDTPKLFGFLLDELQRRGALDAFLNAVRSLPWWDTYLKRRVLAQAAGSAYATDPRIIAWVHEIETLARSTWKGRYDVDAQEIWIDGDPMKVVKPANGSSDDKIGVVALVEPYYSVTARIPQPKPEILDRLREPTRKKVSAIIGRMICEAGEKLTQEELLQRATREAAKELPPLEEKDLVKVTERKSLRVLKLERTVEHGVEEIYVHYQRVRKIGDNPWIPDGKVIKDSPLGFEMGGLLYYHVEHEMAALTVFALAETAVFGAVMIIELGIATLGQLLFFVSVQVVVYRFTTDVEDRTLEGYLTAVLKGELDAVGFKFLAGVTKGLGGFVAGKIVARELVSEVATKWIVFGLRGVVTATGVGAMEATYLFAQDLLTYSRCKGWSNPSKYWERFAYGFAFTLGFEFLGVPLLSPPLRLLLERAADSRAVARVLRAIGKSLPEITDAVIEGSEKVNAALARTAEHEAVPVIAQSLRERVADVLKALGREYESRAYRSLLELYGPELGAEATQGLQRLLKTASEGEIDAVLQRLLARKTSPAELLRALGKADEALIADLVKTGQLAELGVSRRLLALLTQDPDIGVQLLRGPFKSVVGDLERFLGRLEPLPPDAQQSILGALAREKPLQPEILLAAAKQVGILDEPTLGLLEKLRDSKVRVSALFDGSGPSLKEFADDFAKLPQAERAATLENAAGRTPAQLLKQAKLPAKPPDAPKPPPKPPQAPPPAPAERTLAEIERGLQSKGLTRGELRKFVRPTQRMTARVARQVARLLDHFTLDEVRKFADFHSRHGLALDEYTVDLFVDEVARGKLDEMLSKLEHLHAHGEATGAAEWSAEKFAAEADLTVHPGKPPPLSEFVETPGSSVLRASLIERAGEPPPGYHAHHIIPEKQFGPGLDWLRDRLANAGSGINKANNGVFLAGSKSTANPELTRLHNSYIHAGSSNEYAYTLTRRLADKQGAEFLTEVEKIGEEMAKGKFNILEIPRGWKTKWKPGMTAPIEPKVEPVWIDE